MRDDRRERPRKSLYRAVLRLSWAVRPRRARAQGCSTGSPPGGPPRPSTGSYPLQVLIPAALLYHWRPLYQSSPPRRVSWSAAIGLIALGVWVAPQVLLHRAPRLEGFDPGHFGPGLPYALNLTLRLARMIIVVPIVEELFWRGFLMRFVVDPDFMKVPVGAYTRWSFWIVTLGFVLEHQPLDWPAAALTGMLYNLVAYRTGSVGSCIVAHAVTNAALAGYILVHRAVRLLVKDGQSPAPFDPLCDVETPIVVPRAPSSLGAGGSGRGRRHGSGVHALRAGGEAPARARLSQPAGDRPRADDPAHRQVVSPPLRRRALLRHGRHRGRDADHRGGARMRRARRAFALGTDRLFARRARCLGDARGRHRAPRGLLHPLQYLRAESAAPRRRRACAGSRCC